MPLLPYDNPLPERLGKEFFATLPKLPGVYVMYGLANNIIYVGKAKNLKARLLSYRRARPHQVSRKVIRLIHVIDEIKYEVCASEECALLKENELLRKHRPVFNVVNTNPEGYYFIGLKERQSIARGHLLEFKLTTHPEFGPEWERDQFHGAFKGRGSVRDAYQTLLRLIWACQTELERFEFPGNLIKRRVPYNYEVQLSRKLTPETARNWAALIRRFLRGTSDALLTLLTEQLLANASIPPFFYRSIQEDLERLRGFYAIGPARNRKIRVEFGLSDPIIEQGEIDDLLVRYKARRGQRF